MKNKKTTPYNKGDILLIDCQPYNQPQPGQLQEALVLDKTKTAAKVQIKDITIWIPNTFIQANLGPNYWNQQTNPTPNHQPKQNPPLITGTFILEENQQYKLVEIDKINGVYLIHTLETHKAEIITQNHNHTLHTFSKPEEGKYILEPGMYIDSNQLLIEVVPFKGTCWYRFIDQATITPLTQEYAIQLNRIETDEDGLDYYIIEETQPITQKLNTETQLTCCQTGTCEGHQLPQ